MEKVDLLGMFMLGLLGTGHCVGGYVRPPHLRFPWAHRSFYIACMAYHLGRVSTYVAVGAVLGGVGSLALHPDRRRYGIRCGRF